MATAQLILDTDIIIDHLRQRSDTLRRALMKHHCAMAAITLYELLAVPIFSERQTHTLDQLLTVVEVIAFDYRAAKQAANLWRLLNARNESIGLPDTLVAGICLANNLPLLTRNQDHFNRVDNLKLINPGDFSRL